MLRPYQEGAVSKMLWDMNLEGNSIVCLPTGAGKSHIIAEFTKKLGKPVLILVPSKEILEQDYDKLLQVVDPKDIGIFSASMNSKEIKTFTLATIQSAYKVPEKFAHYDVIIIDECDLLNPKNLEGMYNQFFRQIGNPKVIGLTATPYRLDSYYRRWGNQKWQVETVTTIKMLTRYQEKFWKRMLYVVNTDYLVETKCLCPLTYHSKTMIPQENLKFNKSKSDFNLEDFEEKYTPFIDETANLVSNIKENNILIFCATIGQGEMLKKRIKNSEMVTGTTSKKERERIISGFRDNKIRVVINVGVVLVGFDKPDLEAIIIARPTRSLRLHTQMLGRGMRLSPNKTTCNVYDLVGNVEQIGRSESIKIVKLPTKFETMSWNVVSEKRPDGYHYCELYSHKLKSKKDEEEF